MPFQSHTAQALLDGIPPQGTLEPEEIYNILTRDFIEGIGALAIKKGIYSGEDEWSIISEEVREDEETPLVQEAPEMAVDQKYRFLENVFRYTDQAFDLLQGFESDATAQDFIEAIDTILYQAEQYLSQELSLEQTELEQLSEAVKEAVRKIPEGKEAIENFKETLQQEKKAHEDTKTAEAQQDVVDLSAWRKLRR